VLSSEEEKTDPDLIPYVHLEASTMEARNRAGDLLGFAVSVRLSAKTAARNPHNTSWAALELWSRSRLGLINKEEAALFIERCTNELAEDLLNTWLAANPRR
jgi:hypothetical protein